MKISKLRLQNFMSYGDNVTEIDFLKTPTTLVVGVNGRGKSVLFTDAICYVLYNRPFRPDFKKPQLLNMINNKALRVELEFEVGTKQYRIVRGMKPNIFEIWEDGALLNQPNDTRDFQKYLERSILKMSFVAFKQIVVVGKTNFVPFMKLSTPERRKIVEDLLDLEVFSYMKKVLEGLIKATQEDLRDTAHTISLIETTITQKRKAIESIQAQSENLLAGIEEKIATVTAENDRLDVEIKDLNRRAHAEQVGHRDIKNTVLRLTPYEGVMEKLKDKVVAYRKEIDFYQHTDSCQTCKQEISEGVKALRILGVEAEIAKIEEQFPKIEEKLTELRDAQVSLRAAETNFRVLDQKRVELAASMRANMSYLNNLESDKTSLTTPKDDTSVLDEDLKKFEAQLQDVNERRSALLRDKEMQEFTQAMLKDGGIKSRIIAQYMPLLNATLAKYLQVMDFHAVFELDENFNEVVKTRNMENFTFASFSEGEKARIEMALLFTWRDLARHRSSANINLLVLDEVFDGSIDAAGGDSLLELFKQTGASSIVVISHKTDAYIEKFDRTLTVTKKRSFSQIKET